mmetsp:Transcript_74/g.155  ORF Transcript_74/g.155 Transcript_74/m.155 type:complete len:255 (-) Transcript_74:314-1078(-)
MQGQWPLVSRRMIFRIQTRMSQGTAATTIWKIARRRMTTSPCCLRLFQAWTPEQHHLHLVCLLCLLVLPHCLQACLPFQRACLLCQQGCHHFRQGCHPCQQVHHHCPQACPRFPLAPRLFHPDCHLFLRVCLPFQVLVEELRPPRLPSWNSSPKMDSNYPQEPSLLDLPRRTARAKGRAKTLVAKERRKARTRGRAKARARARQGHPSPKLWPICQREQSLPLRPLSRRRPAQVALRRHLHRLLGLLSPSFPVL